MTVENLHDALTLLPDDLVAEAETYRSRKRKVIPWWRYAAMAACFVLVLCAGSFAMLVMTPMGRANSAAPAEVMAETMAQMAMDTVTNEKAAAPGAECGEENIPGNARISGAGEQETASEDSAAAAGTSAVLEEPPRLVLTAEDSELVLSPENYTWTFPQEGGLSDTVTASGPMPTDAADRLPRLLLGEDALRLTWELEPDSVSHRAWAYDGGRWAACALDGAAPEKTEDGSFLLKQTLLQQGQVVEVTAQWPQGSASYSFRLD